MAPVADAGPSAYALFLLRVDLVRLRVRRRCVCVFPGYRVVYGTAARLDFSPLLFTGC